MSTTELPNTDQQQSPSSATASSTADTSRPTVAPAPSESAGKRALVIGATGAVGKDLVQLLLTSPQIAEVHIFVRRPIAWEHDKLKTHVVDFDHVDEWKHLLKGDALFSCMGTTLKAAGSKAAQYKVDFTYQYEVAKAASEAGVRHLLLVSAAMANANSSVFYTRIKGELEDAVKLLPFQRLTIVRPSVMVRKGTTRLGERISIACLRVLNAFGLFRKMHPIATETVARGLVEKMLKPA